MLEGLHLRYVNKSLKIFPEDRELGFGDSIKTVQAEQTMPAWPTRKRVKNSGKEQK